MDPQKNPYAGPQKSVITKKLIALFILFVAILFFTYQIWLSKHNAVAPSSQFPTPLETQQTPPVGPPANP
ncbi:MAG: hypothetical protein AB7F59_04450 [Bdellovibrionales bacterium]